MKIIIFAGGSGKRLWPLSRKKYPKQFQPIVKNKSTIELMVERIAQKYKWEDIFITTNKILIPTIKKTFPKISTSNIFSEPACRDLGAAVGYAMTRLKKIGCYDEPVLILWSDNYLANKKNFQDSLKIGEELIKQNSNRLIFFGEKPTFPNENLGWIELGDKIEKRKGIDVFTKKSFKYRPSLEQAKKWFKNDNFVWNTGYFITTPKFILKQYIKKAPKTYSQLAQIEKSIGTKKEKTTLQKIYPTIESKSFDNIVLEGLKNDETIVLKTNFDWSDPGTLYALKQFLQKDKNTNVTKGDVYNHETRDSLIYNCVKNQTITTIGLDGFIVINTPDATLVCHKKDVGKIKAMLKEFEKTKLKKLL